MDRLLQEYDWHVRLARDDYSCGMADAIATCILSVAKLLGERESSPYRFEAYKRVVEFETVDNYWKKYPWPISNVFPAEEIRKNGGKL